jgi:DNA-directed RNA polymerase specialized sigma24 family protein
VTDPTSRPALCCECGDIRIVSARLGLYDRRLKCTACKATTKHALVGDDPEKDWRESITHHPLPKYPEPSEEEKTAQLLHALEHGGYDACDFETKDERAERITRTKRYGEARDQEFLGLHRQGFSYDEIADMTDWNRETVRNALHKLGVHRFNSSVRKPGLIWEPPT